MTFVFVAYKGSNYQITYHMIYSHSLELHSRGGGGGEGDESVNTSIHPPSQIDAVVRDD